MVYGGQGGTQPTTTNNYTDNYTNYCFNRLPCGICTITQKMCPLVGNQAQITWQLPDITCEVKNDTES